MEIGTAASHPLDKSVGASDDKGTVSPSPIHSLFSSGQQRLSTATTIYSSELYNIAPACPRIHLSIDALNSIPGG
ncbi:hypothetical protein VTL71DRAFT_7334 [Oculimacula yallundae]|uniref:Uncharacterized protein n=1 Tax=Oculimacula yallundae TaxID=86028 RepID=A0ABR4BXI3_9HELO